MAPSCALDEAGLRSQLERYRRAGQGAQLIERAPCRFVVELDERVDGRLIEEALVVERECCPFFVLEWEPSRRRLSVAVAHVEHEPALDAIVFALGLGEGSFTRSSGPGQLEPPAATARPRDGHEVNRLEQGAGRRAS